MASPAESMIEFQPDTSLDEDTIVFDHILNNVLKLPPNHPLRKVIPVNFPYFNISAYLVFTDDEFKAMRYPDPTIPTGSATRMLPILPGAANIFIQFREFIRHKFLLNKTFPLNGEWLNLTNQDWHAFLARPSAPSDPIAPPAPTQAAFTPLSHQPFSKIEHVVNEFRKTVRRDLTLFPRLQDEKNWDSFKRSMTITARSQTIDNFLNPDYMPDGPMEAAVWPEVQKYAYGVLHHSLLTDKGKSLVREHEHDYDAQKVWYKLSQHMTHSVKARFKRNQLLKYITTSSFDSHWNGTAEQYILHWQQQIRA